MTLLSTAVATALLSGLAWGQCQAPDSPSLHSTSDSISALISMRALRSAGYGHYRAGEYSQALACFGESLRLNQAAGANREVVLDLTSLASVSEDSGNFLQARQYYLRELDVLDRLGDAASGARGEIFAKLGALSQAEGQLPASEAAYQKSISILGHMPGPVDLRLAAAVDGLASLYTLWGRFSEAAAALHRANHLAEQVLGENSPDWIRFLDVESTFNWQTGKLSDAEKQWQRALDIAEKTYGENALRYNTILLHLGQAYFMTGDYTSAQRILERGLAAAQRNRYSVDIDRAVVMGTLGEVYTKLKKYAEAGAMFTEANHIMATSGQHLPLGRSMILSYYGDYFMAQGQWQAAAEQYQRALSIREAALGDHPLVANSLLSLSKAVRKLNRKREAKQYAARASAMLAAQQDPRYDGQNTVDVRAFRAQ